MNQKLNIAISSYRSAPFGGGQGIFIYELSKALQALGHNVDIISGPPYPNLEPGINLIKSPGLDLFSTFVFKESNFSGVYIYNYDSELTATEISLN